MMPEEFRRFQVNCNLGANPYRPTGKSNFYQSIILKGVYDGDIDITEALELLGYNVITDMEYSAECGSIFDMIEEEHSIITKESCKTWKESTKPQNKIAPKPYSSICFQLRNKQK